MKTINIIAFCIIVSTSYLSYTGQKKQLQQCPSMGTPLFSISENEIYDEQIEKTLTTAQIIKVSRPSKSTLDASEYFNPSAEDIAYNNLTEEEKEARHRAITASLSSLFSNNQSSKTDNRRKKLS